MYRYAALFLTLLIALPAAAQVVPAHVLPFDLYDGRIYLHVSGPGFSNRAFILDTGAQRTHYVSELVTTAGLRTTGSVGITGTGAGRVRGAWVAPAILRIDTLSLPVGRGIAAPASALFGAIYAGSGRAFDGVIGYDLFAAYVVEIDYGARRIRLYDPARPPARPPSAGTAPLTIADRKPYLPGRLFLADGTALDAILHLDTGFGGALSLNGNYVAQNNLLQRAGPLVPAFARGVGGVSETRLARLSALGVGDRRIAAPIAALALVQGAGVSAHSSGRIGGEILRRFVVTIDYGRRLLILGATPAVDEPFETDMSGLALVADAPDFSTIRVSGVASGSAAARAGVIAGDIVLSVDGRPAADLTLAQIRERLRSDGANLRLRLRRGAEERDLVIPLRRLI